MSGHTPSIPQTDSPGLLVNWGSVIIDITLEPEFSRVIRELGNRCWGLGHLGPRENKIDDGSVISGSSTLGVESGCQRLSSPALWACR